MTFEVMILNDKTKSSDAQANFGETISDSNQVQTDTELAETKMLLENKYLIKDCINEVSESVLEFNLNKSDSKIIFSNNFGLFTVQIRSRIRLNNNLKNRHFYYQMLI